MPRFKPYSKRRLNLLSAAGLALAIACIPLFALTLLTGGLPEDEE